DTLQGDITGYIQTNLVSMTDGQIYTSATLFNEGFRPAVDIGLSVSRIGSKVQSPALKEVSVKLRLEYAQFKELQKLTKMRAKISTEIAKKISRGQTLSEILVQPANSPVSEIEEILVFYAFDVGILEPFGKKEVFNFEKNIFKFVEKNYPELLGDIKFTKELTPQIKKDLNKVFVKFFEEQKIEM
ncbi:MAG: F0F1 ATP synthase subunit alpha, partial [Candidatus Omnitrophota bacterium]